MINGGTALVGLLGNPVSHSLSPAMHNAALRVMDLNWRYLALPCETADLKAVLNGLRAAGCRGLNVTIPHKQTVADLCDELSPLARRLGAVNTLIPLSSGGWKGTNTDVEGFLAPLVGHCSWKGRQGLVVGCGGSARAVVAGLQELELAAITVVGRRREALHEFINDLQQTKAPLAPCLETDIGLSEAVRNADLVVNTTPLGMAQKGQLSDMPLGPDLWSGLRTDAVLYDLIYTPRPTAWLGLGKAKGNRCFDGLEMLVHQGAASLRIWSGRSDVPVETMRGAAESVLNA